MLEDIKREVEHCFDDVYLVDKRIEEIKKEISNLTTFNGGHNRMHISDLFKILDKYKDKEDKYKNAWEELKKISQNDDCGEKTAHDFLWFLEQTMQELEKKHGIEVE